MGCVSSLYTASSHDMASTGRADAAADAGSSPAQQQMTQNAAGDRRTAGAAASDPPERLSPHALARLRQTFTAEAAAGAVQDAYTLGKTLGTARGPRDRARPAARMRVLLPDPRCAHAPVRPCRQRRLRRGGPRGAQGD